MYLSVIIPAYNEAERIIKTLKAVSDYLKKQAYDFEILVVNDGSTDEMVKAVRSLIGQVPNLRLTGYRKNRGKGAAVRQGMVEARGEIRLFTDADNSTAISHLEKMEPLFKAGADVVIGDRAIKGSVIAVRQPFYKEILGKLGNLVIQSVAGLWGIWDTQCGFKAFTANAAQDIFPRMKVDRWGFDVEVLAVAKALGYKIKEIPVRWVNDPKSHVKFKTYFEVLFETFKVRWNLIKNAYRIKK